MNLSIAARANHIKSWAIQFHETVPKLDQNLKKVPNIFKFQPISIIAIL